MQLRVQAIDEGLEAPPYDPKRYKNHYFYPDFDVMMTKMTEDYREQEERRLAAKYNMEENRDFLPYKVAVRLREAIRFTVLLDMQHKDVNNGNELDDDTKAMLKEYDDNCDRHGHFIPFNDYKFDYESFPVLRNHKVRLLEIMLKSFIDRKYKISLSKGMMLVMEQLVLLVSLASMILKANVFSFIYLVFVFRFFRAEAKVNLLVRVSYYISFLLVT